MPKRLLTAAFICCLGQPLASARADPVADFYKGRTVQVVIGTGTGGGYSVYARLAVDHMARHVPGGPTFVMQSMPGAGGKNMLNYAAKVAPKDGTFIFLILQAAAVDQVMRAPGVAYDVREFGYVGRFTDNTAVSMGWVPAGVDSIEVVRQRVVVTGGTGATSPTDIIPKLLNRYAGTKYKLVTGYKGLPEIAFAMENGEVQAMVGSWVGFKTDFARLLNDKKIMPLVQLAPKRHPELAAVPTAGELASTDMGRAVVGLAASSADMGRAIAAPPGVPADRLRALQTAFSRMLANEAFRAEAARINADLNPASGEALAAVAEATLRTPQAAVREAAEVLGGDAVPNAK